MITKEWLDKVSCEGKKYGPTYEEFQKLLATCRAALYYRYCPARMFIDAETIDDLLDRILKGELPEGQTL